MEEIMVPQMYWGGWTKEGGGQDTFPLPTSQNIPKQTVCPGEIWGRGQKVYKNHIPFDPRGGGERELFLPPPPHPQITEQHARIKLKYGQD